LDLDRVLSYKEGTLRNAVFVGKFRGEVKNGILIGNMKGELTGKKIAAETMQQHWAKTKTELSV